MESEKNGENDPEFENLNDLEEIKEDDEKVTEKLEIVCSLGLTGSGTSIGGSKRDLGGFVVEREKSAFESLELSVGGSSSQRLGCDTEFVPPLGGNVVDYGQPSLIGGEEDSDCDLQHKRAKVESSFGCHYSTEGPSCTDNNNFDALRSYPVAPNCFVCSKNKIQDVMAPVDDFVNFDKDGEFIEGHADSSDIDDLGVPLDLSDDLLHMVFSFLGHAHLCTAAMVCKQWRVASTHENFWRSLDFENRNITVAQLEDICHRYPRATEVNLCGNRDMHMLVMRAVALLRNLVALTLGRGQLGEAFFNNLSDCPLLTQLVVCDAALGNGVQEISINHDRLQHLQVTKCRVLRVSVRCPKLVTLSFKRTNMAHVVLNCPLLLNLDIGSCHKLPDAAIRSAVVSCPLLENLDMSCCSCVSDETLREISQACPNLRELNASYCPNISLEAVKMQLLTVLKLESCEGITSASMAAIALSNLLEVLELDFCNLLTSVSLELPHLRNLSLVHCRKFVELNLRCFMLSSLNVSNCPLLHRISITSHALNKLSLHKQESLISLSLQCEYLEEVDLSDCESLTNSVCDVFSDGGGCPMLKSLKLDNCESLTAVRLHSTSLVSLSLAGCRGITTLTLECPFLDQVRLDGCDHLERVSFLPVGMRSLNLGICPKLSALHIDAPHMTGLELKGCGALSEASINCPLLTSLDASFCSQLTDECLSATTVSCPLIDKLILMSCPSVGSDGLSSLRWLSNLTYLDLSYTFLMDLQPVFSSCLRLTVLKLQACKYLNDSSLEALYKEGALPSLRELDLSYGTLCQSSIEELLVYCTHLTHVSLNGCIHMHDLDWGFTEFISYQASSLPSSQHVNEPIVQPHRSLENLNCVGCPNIKRVHIPLNARCMHLSSLNLSLSQNLKEVDVACSDLCFLNLSNCCSLENLKLDCPKLTSLFLQSCNIDEEAVESAIAECRILETLDVRFCPKFSSVAANKFRAIYPSLKRVFFGSR
ncbi:unnamed protein product [Amaranthus hypochondriacus]